MPEISIIIPCYNAAPYMATCVEACLKQTFSDFELLLIDDGSDDSTLEVCRLYERMDARVQVVNGAHEGVAMARKKGIEKACGTYIAFADSDDVMDCNWLFEMYKKAKRYQADVVATAYYRLENGTKSEMSIPGIAKCFYQGAKYETEILSNLFYHKKAKQYDIMPHLWNKLFRSELLKPVAQTLDMRIQRGEDCVLCYGTLLMAKSFYYIERPLYTYCVRTDSQMSRVLFSNRENNQYLFENLRKLVCLEKHEELLDSLGMFEEFVERLAKREDEKRLANNGEENCYKEQDDRKTKVDSDAPNKEDASPNVKVSVIVMIYHVEAYLRQCLESLRQQTLSDMEFILVDDGSDDGCGAICDAYAEMDSRFIVLHRPHEGIVKGRQAGVLAARGEYIGAVDGDDWVSSGMYETLYESAKKHNAEIAQCMFMGHMGDEKFSYSRGKHSLDAIVGKQYEQNIRKRGMGYSFLSPEGISHSLCDKIIMASVLKEMIMKIPPECYFGEDGACVLRSLQKATGISFVNEPLYHYRIHVGSVTREFDSTIYERIFQLRDSLLFDNGPQKELLECQADALMIRLIALAIEKDYYYSNLPTAKIRKRIRDALKNKRVSAATERVSISMQKSKKQKLMWLCVKYKIVPPKFLLGKKAKGKS